jgi:2-hydroxychromene-2-carboxylate isomerase
MVVQQNQDRSTQRPVVDYYFSFISLWSYVGSLVFREMIERHDIEVNYKPIDLLAAFAVGGGLPVKERAPQRQAYRLVEMQRWREIRGISLVLHPRYYPVDPELGHRMLLVALERGENVGLFVHAALKAVWADELNIADPDTLVSLADASGLDGMSLLQAAANPAIAERSSELTDEAIARKVFGAPFYFYRDEPFWGQDRLDMLDGAIASGRQPVRFVDP